MITLFLFLIGFVGTATALAQDPPQYLVTTMENDQGESFRPVDINNAGLAVLGKYSNPHFYVSATGLMYDLNNLGGAMWHDLETGNMWAQTTTPWIADSARGINESNQIVGTAYDPIGPARIFVLENPLGPNPVFKLLPEFGNGVTGDAINDDGVAVGRSEGLTVVFDPRTLPDPYTPVGILSPVGAEPQEINIHGDIVARGENLVGGLVISPAGIYPDGSFNYEQAAVHYFEGHLFYGINDSRQICGSRPSTGRGRNRQSGGTARFQYDPDATNDEDRLVADPLIVESSDVHFGDVNEFGDVAFGFRANVYREDLADPGPYALDQLVVFAAPDDEAKWNVSGRAQANGINEQGQIIVRGDGSMGFFLTPIPNTPLPGITATPENGLVTTEAGGSDTFIVQLNTAPGGSVTLAVASLDPSEGITDVNNLAFDDSNWNMPQQVNVTGAQDSETDGDQPYFIELAVITAPAGSGYENLAPVLVGVTNEDDEISAATLAVDGSTIVEGDRNNNTPGQFTVTLNGTASGTVEVSYQVSNGSARRNRDYRMIDSPSGQLVFTPGGPTSQTVAFEIIGDNADELNEDFTITLSNADGATITMAVGTVTILDDD